MNNDNKRFGRTVISILEGNIPLLFDPETQADGDLGLKYALASFRKVDFPRKSIPSAIKALKRARKSLVKGGAKDGSVMKEVRRAIESLEKRVQI